MLGYYIHIPFCDRICSYCDFAKHFYRETLADEYLRALSIERSLYQKKTRKKLPKTVYFGGGTPSSLTEKQLYQLLSIFKEEIMQAKEVTFEANPESLTREKLKILKAFGINRVSLGVQSFSNRNLVFLNRGHRYIDIVRVIDDMKNVGIKQYNLDIMYALPEQTLEAFQNDLENFLQLMPTHLSAYALIIEPHTKLFQQLEQKKVVEVGEDVQYLMYNYLCERLKSTKYEHYEVSNWAKEPNFYSQHNINYWKQGEYVGLGLGAHGHLDKVRYANTKSMTKYLRLLLEEKDFPIYTEEKISLKMEMEEFVFLGLRMMRGIETHEFKRKFGFEIETIFGTALSKHLKKGNLLFDGKNYYFAPRAIFISNEILTDFL